MIVSNSPTIKYGAGYKYQLKEYRWFQTKLKGNHSRIEDPDDIRRPWIRLTLDGVLEIRAGYAWNGASGPTFDTKSTMRASLVHDALYQLMRAGKISQEDRKAADELLFALLIQDGCWAWRASAWLWAVRKFAAYAAAERPEPFEVAP